MPPALPIKKKSLTDLNESLIEMVRGGTVREEPGELAVMFNSQFARI